MSLTSKLTLSLVGLPLLLLGILFLAPTRVEAYVFCSTGAGQATCLSICQANGYDGMYPGTGISGQSTGTAGYYCANGDDATITRMMFGSEDEEGFSFEEVEILKEAPDASEENYVYLDSGPASNINVIIKEVDSNISAAETGFGRFMDSFSLMMKDFVSGILQGDFQKAFNSRDYFSGWTSEVEQAPEGEFLVAESEYEDYPVTEPGVARGNYYIYTHNCPPEIRVRSTSPLEPNWDYWCRKSKEVGKIGSSSAVEQAPEGEFFVAESEYPDFPVTDPGVARNDYYIYEHDCPPRIRVRSTSPLEPNWDYWCRKAKGGKTSGDSGVVTESVPGVTDKELYCEIGTNLPDELQVAELQKCVNESDLSAEEKSEVLQAVRFAN